MENFRFPGTFVPGTFSSRELSFLFRSPKLSFPGPFVFGNFRSRRRKVPGNFRSCHLSYPGTFVPIIRFVSDIAIFVLKRDVKLQLTNSHYPISPVAALLCVLNYCMFGCEFTLMMLTPLWTSQLMLYIGRPAFAARLSVFDVPITVSLRTKCLR